MWLVCKPLSHSRFCVVFLSKHRSSAQSGLFLTDQSTLSHTSRIIVQLSSEVVHDTPYQTRRRKSPLELLSATTSTADDEFVYDYGIHPAVRDANQQKQRRSRGHQRSRSVNSNHSESINGDEAGFDVDDVDEDTRFEGRPGELSVVISLIQPSFDGTMGVLVGASLV